MFFCIYWDLCRWKWGDKHRWAFPFQHFSSQSSMPTFTTQQVPSFDFILCLLIYHSFQRSLPIFFGRILAYSSSSESILLFPSSESIPLFPNCYAKLLMCEWCDTVAGEFHKSNLKLNFRSFYLFNSVVIIHFSGLGFFLFVSPFLFLDNVESQLSCYLFFFSLSFFTEIATWIKFEAMSKVRDRTEDFKDSVRRAALDLGYNEVLLLHVHLYFLDNFNRHCMLVSYWFSISEALCKNLWNPYAFIADI